MPSQHLHSKLPFTTSESPTSWLLLLISSVRFLCVSPPTTTTATLPEYNSPLQLGPLLPSFIPTPVTGQLSLSSLGKSVSPFWPLF